MNHWLRAAMWAVGSLSFWIACAYAGSAALLASSDT